MKVNRRRLALGLAILGLCAILEILPYATADASGQRGASFSHHLKVSLAAFSGLLVLGGSVIGTASARIKGDRQADSMPLRTRSKTTS